MVVRSGIHVKAFLQNCHLLDVSETPFLILPLQLLKHIRFEVAVPRITGEAFTFAQILLVNVRERRPKRSEKRLNRGRILSGHGL
jgi:hypothetical protein